MKNVGKIFRNIFVGSYVRGGAVVLRVTKSLQLSNIEKRGISDENSIVKISNEGFGYMKGYKHKLKDRDDRILAQWIILNVQKGLE